MEKILKISPFCRKDLKKLLLIMKLSFVLMLVGVINISASVYSQNKKFTFSNTNATIEQILDDVEKQSEFKFFFQREQINVDTKVDINIKDGKVENVLDKIFEDENVKYKVYDNNLIILVPASEQGKKEVTGIVSDQTGMSLPGVNITVKGTTDGVMTDAEGNFTINVKDDAVLVFNFIGYRTQEIKVGAQATMNVVMAEDVEGLDEVVVIGYGTMKKSDLTGAVASVKGDELNTVAVSSPAQALQGKISGVSIKSISGAPGAGVEVKIRGVGSFGGNSPLYIIDGVPGDINYLSPDEIKSIEVLKDASSAAIYGSRAANGVVLVTTKGGVKDGVKIAYNGYYGVQKVINTLDLLNTNQWYVANKQMHENVKPASQSMEDYALVNASWLASTWDKSKNANTNWQNEILQTAITQSHSVTVQSGSNGSKYVFSAGYMNQEGIVLNTGLEQYNARFKATIKKGKLKIMPNISVFSKIVDNPTVSYDEMRKIVPMIPVYDESKPNGYGYFENVLTENNPVGKLNLIDRITNTVNVNTNLALEYEIAKGFTAKVNTSMRNFFYNYRSHAPSYKINGQKESKYVNVVENNYRKQYYLVEPTITYSKDILNHSFTLLGGSTFYKTIYRNANVSVDGQDSDGNKAGFSDENFNTLGAGKGGTFSVDGTEITYARMSYFGRVNYSFESKYLFQATVRRDGSSKFGSDTRWGTFPSFSAGWNIHREDFFAPLTDIVSSLKLRASYGILGSETNLDNYGYSASVYNGSGYNLGKSQNPVGSKGTKSLENTQLQWEETRASNYGVDFGILKGKVSGTINYYVNERFNMLLNRPVPYSSGISNPVVNIGEMRNRGVELELIYRDTYGDFSWGVSGTFTTVDNEVLKMNSDDEFIWGSDIDWTESVTRTSVGDPVASLYVYQMDGVFQTAEEVIAHNSKGYKNDAGDVVPLQENAKPGDVRFKDVNGDGKINSDDKVFSGSGIPDFEYSLNFDLKYKAFDFSLFLQGVHGNEIYNTTKYHTEHMKKNSNFSTNVMDAWTNENRSTSMPRAAFGDPNDNARVSTRFVEDGSYLRVKAMQLGYTLPKSISEKANIDKLRLYVSAQNLLTFTNYTGYDPEIGTSENNGGLFDLGVDWGGYPLSKTIMFGIQLNF